MEGKTKLPVLYCKNALQTLIDQIKSTNSDCLKKNYILNQRALSDRTNKSMVETSDGCSIVYSLVF